MAASACPASGGLTAHTNSDEASGANAVFDDYITKPINIRDFTATVKASHSGIASDSLGGALFKLSSNNFSIKRLTSNGLESPLVSQMPILKGTDRCRFENSGFF